MQLVNEKLGINAELKEDFTQAEFEKYQTILIEGTEEAKAESTISRMIVKAATDAGILTGFDKKLEECQPRVIRWLTLKIRDFLVKQTEVPLD